MAKLCENLALLAKNTFVSHLDNNALTLPANRAISLNPEFKYDLIEANGELLILAADLVEEVMKTIVEAWAVLGSVRFALELLRFNHPLWALMPAILGDHVTLDAVLVLFILHQATVLKTMVGQKYGLETANPCRPDGCFLPNTYPTLDGVFIFKANDLIVELLSEKGALLYKQAIQHSYPCCWRHKTPVIATPVVYRYG